MENIDGKDLKLRPLPSVAQMSAMNGFVHDDLDGNGTKEVLAAGNFFPYKAQWGRNDASAGFVLTYHQGDLKVDNGILANVWLEGDIRDITLLRFKSGLKRVVVSRNNDSAAVYAPVEKQPDE
jgi:hypothetical protein